MESGEQDKNLKLRYSGCDECPLIGLLNPCVSSERAIEIDLVDHTVIGIREIRAETLSRWKQRGVRFGTPVSPINPRTSEVSEYFALKMRERMSSMVAESVTEGVFHAALIACSCCVSLFEVNVQS